MIVLIKENLPVCIKHAHKGVKGYREIGECIWHKEYKISNRCNRSKTPKLRPINEQLLDSILNEFKHRSLDTTGLIKVLF